MPKLSIFYYYLCILMKSLVFTYYFFFSFLSVDVSKEHIANSEKELTVENLYLELIKQDVKHPEIVLRQSILETGWFTCESCSLQKNNIFGFYYKKKYIEFDSWQESVAYYKRWQTRHYKGGDYYAFLKRVGFATLPQYVSRLKSINVDIN